MPGAPPVRKKNTGRTCLTVFLSVVGGLALLGGGALTAHAFSNANQDVANRDEYGPVMWRNEPAEKLFPKTLGDKEHAQDTASSTKHAQWRRMGISQDVGCEQALSGSTAAKAGKLGCKAALRATYVDPTGNTVATVALVVLPEGDSAQEEMDLFFDAERDKRTPPSGVKAFGVKGTSAARWSDAHRNGFAGVTATDMHLPYALVATAGAVDGRRAGHLPGEWGSGGLDAKSDRGPWREAANTLADHLNLHLGDLLLKGSS